MPKYIVTKGSDNVIFEFKRDGKVTRKWIKKEEIILLTEDKEFFIKTMDQFKNVEATQQKLIDEAQAKLEQSMVEFTENVNAEIDEFEEIRDSTDVPCILKEL
ncbi:MAG: hypothetical protein ABFQ64_05670 [Campylobacterota bacterium]